jgi:HAE1 family hydrophobic/amphiphilic exporter-1
LAFTITFSLFAALMIALTLAPLFAARIPLPEHEGYLSEEEKEALRLRTSPWMERARRWLPCGLILRGGRRLAAAVGAWPVPTLGNEFATVTAFMSDPDDPSAPAGYSGGYDASELSWKVKIRRFTQRARITLHTRFWPVVFQNIRGLKHHPRRTFVHWCAWSLRRQKPIFLSILALAGLSVLLYQFVLEKEFLGTTEQNEFVIFVELPAGAKLDISDQVVAEVEKVLSDTPEIANVVKTAAARVEGWSSKVYVTLNPRSERARSVQDIISDLRPKVAEIGSVYGTFIYFSEPESSKEFLIDVFGQDYEALKDAASNIANQLQNVKGLTDVKLRYKPGRPEVKINIDKDRAALFGFTVKDIADTLHAQIRGLRATYFHTESQQIEVVPRLQEKFRKTLEDVHFLTLLNPQGDIIPLEQVASFEFALTPSEIWRKDKQRMIQASANRERLALSTAAKKARKALKNVNVPAGYYFQIGGDYVTMLQNEKEFRFAFIVMVGLVYIVLASMFESYLHPLLIMFTIPMALIGSIPLLLFTGTPVTMGVYIGMIMLGGIVVNNAIILIDQMNLSVAQGRPLLRSVLQVSQLRLSPILNTSLTTILGLLPMIWGRSESSQLWAPLALTVIGGLTVATFLTLFVVPPVYYFMEKYKGAKSG